MLLEFFVLFFFVNWLAVCLFFRVTGERQDIHMYIACLNRATGQVQYAGGVVCMNNTKHVEKQEEVCLKDALKVETAAEQRVLTIIKMRDLTQSRPWVLTIPADFVHADANPELKEKQSSNFKASLGGHFRAFSLR